MVSKLLAPKLEHQEGSIVPHLPLFGRESAEMIPGPSSLQRIFSVESVPPPRPLDRKSSAGRKRWAYKTCLAEIVSAFQSQKSRDGVAHNSKQNQRQSSTSTTVSSMVDDILQSAELTESSSNCDLAGVDENLALASMEGENFGITPRKECERPSNKADIQTNDYIHNDDGGSFYSDDLESIIKKEPSDDKMSSAVPRRPRNSSPSSNLESGSNQKSKSRGSASSIDRKRSSSTHRHRLSRRTSTRHLDVNDDTLRSSGSRRTRGSVSSRNLLSGPSTALSVEANEQEDISKTISSKSSNQSERDDATSDNDDAFEKESRLERIQSCDPSQTRRPSRSTRSRVVDWRKKAEGFEELLDDLRVSSTEFRSHISKEENTAEACDDEKDSKENLQNSGNGKGRRRGNSLWTYHEGPLTSHDRGSRRPVLTRQRSIKCLLLSDNEDDLPPMSSSFKEHSIRRRG